MLILLKTGEGLVNQNSLNVYPHIIDENGSFVTNQLEKYESFIVDNEISYGIKLNDRTLQINLRLSKDLIREVSLGKSVKKCHFQGAVKSYRYSLAALSICKGLVSSFKY